MSESTPPITTPAEAATAQLAAHPPLNRCREFEERFSALRLWRSKDGVQLWGDPVILDEGGAWVCRLGPSLMRVSGIALTEAQQEVARHAAWNAIGGPRYKGHVSVRMKGEKRTIGFDAEADTPETAACMASLMAVDDMRERVAQAERYLNARRDDLRRAELLRDALKAAADHKAAEQAAAPTVAL